MRRSDPSVRPVIFIDVFSVFFRAHHALPAMSTTFGEPTSALYGFCSLLLKLLREHLPRAIAFALDAPQQTFRHISYGAYKAGRPRTPSEVSAQLERLHALLHALGVPVFIAPGFEADDVLATLADKVVAPAGEQGRDERDRSADDERRPDRDARALGEVLVVSGDRDLLQLARDGVRILFLGARGREPTLYDAAAVEQRFEVCAAQLPSWMALVGDTSDNLPGVAGVGARTAAKLVREFGSVEGILTHLSAVGPPKVRQAIVDGVDQLRLNEQLARLRHDVPLGEGPFAAPLDAGGFAQLRQLFGELEFASLGKRLQGIEALLLPGDVASDA